MAAVWDIVPYEIIVKIAKRCDRRSKQALKCSAHLFNDLIRVPIQLYDYQKPHYERICGILEKSPSYLDTSTMGAGKTIVTLKVALTLQLPMVIICPVALICMWEREANKYGVEILKIMSYATLRGTCTHPPTHGLLTLNAGRYYPTQKYVEMVQQGVLLVFDEVQNLKNKSSQLDSAVELTRTILGCGGSSRIAALSATPCDKIEGVESLLKVIGIINQYDDLVEYDRSKRTCNSLGLQEAYDTCLQYDPVRTSNLHITVMRKKEAFQLCYDLYTQILKQHISSAAIPPPKNVNKDVKNGFYKVSPEEFMRLRTLIDELATVLNYNEETGEVRMTKGGLGTLIKVMMKVEEEKLAIFYRLIVDTLENVPNSKVIVYLNYLDNIFMLRQFLTDYNPSVMTGSHKGHERDRIVNKFQEPNSKSRVLISNAKVGGVGLSLDDTDGKWPRHVFISASYHFIDLHQITGRVYRANTKSDAHISFVYIQGLEEEQRILNSLVSKSDTTRGMLYDENNGEQFPGEHHIVDEL